MEIVGNMEQLHTAQDMSAQYISVLRIANEVRRAFSLQTQPTGSDHEQSRQDVSTRGFYSLSLNAPTGWHYRISPCEDGELQCDAARESGGRWEFSAVVLPADKFSEEDPIRAGCISIDIERGGSTIVKMLGRKLDTRWRRELHISDFSGLRDGRICKVVPTRDKA